MIKYNIFYFNINILKLYLTKIKENINLFPMIEIINKLMIK